MMRTLVPALPSSATRPARTRVAPPRARFRWLATGLAVIAVALLLAACGAERPVLAPVDPSLRASTTTAAPVAAPASEPSTTTTAPVHASLRADPHTMQGLIATPIGNPIVHKSPKLTSPVIPVARANALGVTTVFAVVGDDSAAWVEVLLPTRPNGTTGWVQRSRVRVTTTDLRVFVNLRRRLLTVNRRSRTLLQTKIAVGTVANPTPTGATYITELLDTGKPDGLYGPYAFGLALHSDTLSEFGGGDGQVGIHGTNAPALIGQRVSHGCVRLTNADVRRLVNLKFALGTPVFIS
jgi:lipoprotein-anchoring transpeptidase ErfK/SrfK